MSVFIQELKRLQPCPHNRRWLFVLCDQLSDQIAPLSREDDVIF